jgi:hypothetical protein
VAARLEAGIEQLRTELEGRVVTARDVDYEQARVVRRLGLVVDTKAGSTSHEVAHHLVDEQLQAPLGLLERHVASRQLQDQVVATPVDCTARRAPSPVPACLNQP